MSTHLTELNNPLKLTKRDVESPDKSFIYNYFKILNVKRFFPKIYECDNCRKHRIVSERSPETHDESKFEIISSSPFLYVVARELFLKNRYYTRTSEVDLMYVCEKCAGDPWYGPDIDKERYLYRNIKFLTKPDWGYFINKTETLLRLFRKRDCIWQKLQKDLFDLMLQYIVLAELEHQHSILCVDNCDYHESIDECENDGNEYIPRCGFVDSWMDLLQAQKNSFVDSKNKWESQFY